MERSDLSMYNIDLMRLYYCGLLPKARGAYSRHEHDVYEFHYIVAGRGSFELGDRWLAVRPGCFFYTRPHTEHRSAVPTDGDYLLQYIAFLELDTELDAVIATDLETYVGEGTLHRLGDRYHEFFAQISRLSETNAAYERRAATFRFAALLYELLAGTPGSDPGHPAVERALEFMRSHIGEAYGLNEMVDAVGLDKSYFVRLFKKRVGVPPMRYGANLKMSAAANLLHSSEEPLAAVAAQVGFADEYHFAKRFKQWSGVPPGAYRRRG
jgi:AraC-like DNA-binding protein